MSSTFITTISLLPSSSQHSMAQPKCADWISPLCTGKTEFSPMKQAIISVPPQMDPNKTFV